ncbi:MAG TPA: tautomerase family protein [Nitriliruptorales bacterium]
MAVLELRVLGGLEDQERAQLLTDVHRSLVEVLRVPDDDPTVLITDIDPDSAIAPGGRSSYALATVTMFSGRSRETIARLIERLQGAVGGATRLAPDDVTVVVLQSPRSCWSAPGGPTAADVDLGFEVEI